MWTPSGEGGGWAGISRWRGRGGEGRRDGLRKCEVEGRRK